MPTVHLPPGNDLKAAGFGVVQAVGVAGADGGPNAHNAGPKQLGELVVYDRTSYEESDLVAERIGDADVAILNKTPISKATMDQCPPYISRRETISKPLALALFRL